MATQELSPREQKRPKIRQVSFAFQAELKLATLSLSMITLAHSLSPSIFSFSDLPSHSFHLSSLALSHTLIKIPVNLADYKRH